MSEPGSRADRTGPTTGRLPLLRPEELDAHQRAIHESVAGGPRRDGPFAVADQEGRLLGPFNALLHHPGVGAAVERLGAALRFEGGLGPRARELVICAVAVSWQSDYEWYAHRRVARAAGIGEEELEALAAGDVPGGLDAGEESALRLAHALLRERVVGDDVYESAVRHHHHAGVVEITALVGYYQLLAGLLATADVGAPEEDR